MTHMTRRNENVQSNWEGEVLLTEQWDDGTQERASLRASIRYSNGQLDIAFAGYGDKTSAQGYGRPVLIELYQGSPHVVIWADTNREDPTHRINLSAAAESARDES